MSGISKPFTPPNIRVASANVPQLPPQIAAYSAPTPHGTIYTPTLAVMPAPVLPTARAASRAGMMKVSPIAAVKTTRRNGSPVDWTEALSVGVIIGVVDFLLDHDLKRALIIGAVASGVDYFIQ